MPDPVMRPVYSSHVNRIGWAEGALFVEWDTGRTSVYDGVPEKLAGEVGNAWSVGKALHESVKGRFQHRYIDDE